MSRSKIEGLVNSIYRELYKNSTPPADFDKLIEKFNADMSAYKTEEERMLNVEKHKFYNNHSIDAKLMDDIIGKHLAKSKISNYLKDKVKATVILGCSPKYNYSQ